MKVKNWKITHNEGKRFFYFLMDRNQATLLSYIIDGELKKGKQEITIFIDFEGAIQPRRWERK